MFPQHRLVSYLSYGAPFRCSSSGTSLFDVSRKKQPSALRWPKRKYLFQVLWDLSSLPWLRGVLGELFTKYISPIFFYQVLHLHTKLRSTITLDHLRRTCIVSYIITVTECIRRRVSNITLLESVVCVPSVHPSRRSGPRGGWPPWHSACL